MYICTPRTVLNFVFLSIPHKSYRLTSNTLLLWQIIVSFLVNWKSLDTLPSTDLYLLHSKISSVFLVPRLSKRICIAMLGVQGEQGLKSSRSKWVVCICIGQSEACYTVRRLAMGRSWCTSCEQTKIEMDQANQWWFSFGDRFPRVRWLYISKTIGRISNLIG